MNGNDSRCTGCRWRTPYEFGGQGMLCLQKNGKCPEWVIKWAVRFMKRPNGRPLKWVVYDEELLEVLRL